MHTPIISEIFMVKGFRRFLLMPGSPVQTVMVQRSGGCTFCNNEAFNPSYCNPLKSVTQQISEGIIFHRKRYRRANSFLAYFQPYSNTYAPLEKLKELYEEALGFPGVVGIIVGTRPDCVDEEKLSYMSWLGQRYYIAVEYGIESCYNKTLERINRGHTFEEAEQALIMTSSMGIRTGAHFIFGLPGETREEMLAEASIISRLPLTTVKFHQLQIFKGTMMESEYRKNPSDFQLFSWDEYLSFFVRFLEKLNPGIVVERFTGEAPLRFHTREVWDKKRSDQFADLIEKRLEELDTWQGRLYNS